VLAKKIVHPVEDDETEIAIQFSGATDLGISGEGGILGRAYLQRVEVRDMIRDS
jgi:hypothetical protein